MLASGDMPAAFAIWGEQSPNVRIRPRPPHRRAGSSEGRGPFGQRPAQPVAIAPPHPFALSDDGVRHALSVMGLTRWATQTNVRHVFACVPSLPDAEPPYGAPHRSTEPADAVENLKLGLSLIDERTLFDGYWIRCRRKWRYRLVWRKLKNFPVCQCDLFGLNTQKLRQQRASHLRVTGGWIPFGPHLHEWPSR